MFSDSGKLESDSLVMDEEEEEDDSLGSIVPSNGPRADIATDLSTTTTTTTTSSGGKNNKKVGKGANGASGEF